MDPSFQTLQVGISMENGRLLSQTKSRREINSCHHQQWVTQHDQTCLKTQTHSHLEYHALHKAKNTPLILWYKYSHVLYARARAVCVSILNCACAFWQITSQARPQITLGCLYITRFIANSHRWAAITSLCHAVPFEGVTVQNAGFTLFTVSESKRLRMRKGQLMFV